MWILPSYNRPESCAAVIQAIKDTGCTTPGVLMIQGVEHRKAYEAIELPANWKRWLLAKNIGLCGAVNAAVKMYDDAPFYGLIGDDIFPETEHWDLRLLEKIGPRQFGNCHDGWSQGDKLCGITVWGGELVRAVGYLAPPGLWHCYWDDMWEMIGREIGGRVLVESVKCRSPHVFNNDAAADATIKTSYSRFDADRDVFKSWLGSDDQQRAWREARRVIKGTFSLKGRSLYIATPAGDGKFVQEWVHSYTRDLKAFARYGIDHGLLTLQKCSILEHARNRMIAEFLASRDGTHFMFIDSDMGWPEHAILEMLAHLEQTDYEVVAAAGVTKEKQPKVCARLFEDFKPARDYDDKRGLIRAKEVGAAFLMMKRAALEKCFKAREHLAYEEPDAPGLKIAPIFRIEYEGGKARGEDFGFCKLWRELGGDIWVDPSIRLEHVGQFAYTGTWAEILRANDEEKRRHAQEAA